MSGVDVGVNCEVAEMVNCCSLRWYGQVEGLEKCDITRKVHLNKIDAASEIGRPSSKVRG